MKERLGRKTDRPQDEGKYTGNSSPKKHIKDCTTSWESQGLPSNRWVHTFIHTLGTIARALYIQEQLRQQMASWGTLEAYFIDDFSFKGNEAQMSELLQAIKGVLFTPKTLVEGGHEEKFLQCLYDMELSGFVTCDKIDVELEEDGLEGLRHLAF